MSVPPPPPHPISNTQSEIVLMSAPSPARTKDNVHRRRAWVFADSRPLRILDPDRRHDAAEREQRGGRDRGAMEAREIELPRDHTGERDREQTGDARDRVVHRGSDARLFFRDRAEDRARERRDGDREADADDDDSGKELGPILERLA